MMKNKKAGISRRDFLHTTSKGAIVVSAAGVIGSCSMSKEKSKDKSDEKSNDIVAGQIPRRVLGKTGIEASILSFGGGSQFLKNKNGEWEAILEESIRSGINLYDTSPDYTVVSRDGTKAMTCDERFGEILPPYRDKVIIITKINDRMPGNVKKTLEASLKTMKTDYVDILMLHSVDDRDDVLDFEKGVYSEMIAMKSEGLVKHIGISSMDSAQRSKDMLTHLDFDVAMLALNPTAWGDYPGLAFPIAMEKNVGIIAMKVLRGLVGEGARAEELLNYSWSQPGVTSSVIGHYGMETLKENIRLAKEYGTGQLAFSEKRELEARLAPYAGPHALPWARKGYKDGGIIV